MLTPDGKLMEAGYLTRHRRIYNSGPAQESISHKRWDFYGVFLPDFTFFSVAIADLGLLRNVFVTIKVGDVIDTKE
jgi:hypothetical protein